MFLHQGGLACNDASGCGEEATKAGREEYWQGLSHWIEGELGQA